MTTCSAESTLRVVVLADEQVEAIKREHAAGRGTLSIAVRLGVPHLAVRHILHGKRDYDGSLIRGSLDGTGTQVTTVSARRGSTRAKRAPEPRRRKRANAGEQNRSAKLTEEQARDIYHRAHSGESVASIARDYGIDRRTVRGIRDRTMWRHIHD